MPPWADPCARPHADVVCRMSERLADIYPVEEIDVVVVGIFHQVCDLVVCFLCMWGWR